MIQLIYPVGAKRIKLIRQVFFGSNQFLTKYLLNAKVKVMKDKVQDKIEVAAKLNCQIFSFKITVFRRNL